MSDTTPLLAPSLEPAYIAVGVLLAFTGARHLTQHYVRGAFWILLGALISLASVLPTWLIGAGVLLSALLAFAATSQRPALDELSVAERGWKHQSKLLHPAVLLPVSVLLLTLVLQYANAKGMVQIAKDQVALFGLVLGAGLSLIFACLRLRVAPQQALRDGASVIDQIGWPILLPLLLAILGSVFTAAKLGGAMTQILDGLFPTNNPILCCVVYGASMAAFTMMMGNAFAAFPVMTAAIGIPLIVQTHHGNPVIMASLGMLCGYCGTLMTPLAANFNLVPAALLNLNDRMGVIKAQIGTAIPLLIVNIALMSWLVYRY
jgi:uncharacterized membrane protein